MYLLGRKFKVYTDHAPLSYSMKIENLPAAPARWLTEMQMFDMEIIYRRGEENVVADYLSRLEPQIEKQNKGKDNTVVPSQVNQENAKTSEMPNFVESAVGEQKREKKVTKPTTMVMSAIEQQREEKPTAGNFEKMMQGVPDEELEATPLEYYLGIPVNAVTTQEKPKHAKMPTLQQIGDYQKSDAHLQEIIRSVNGKINRKGVPDTYFMKNGVLWQFQQTKFPGKEGSIEEKILVPRALIPVILHVIHDYQLSHAGFFKTIQKVREQFTFPNMYSIIRDFVLQCNVCGKVKSARQTVRPPHIEKDIPTDSMQELHVDLVGSFKTSSSGNNYILTMCDPFSKYCNLVAIPDAKSSTVCRAIFDHHFRHFGVCLTIRSDNGPCFTNSQYFTSFMKVLGIKHARTTSYAPFCNPFVEKFHAILGSLLKCVCTDPLKWDQNITSVLLSYNNSIHTATQCSPSYVFLQRHIRLPQSMYIEPEEKELQTASEFVRQTTENLWEINKTVRERLKKLAEKDLIVSFNKQKLPRKGFNVGDLCYLKRGESDRTVGRKLTISCQGPYKILQVFGNTARIISLQKLNKSFVVHISRLRRCEDPSPLIHVIPEEFLVQEDEKGENELLEPSMKAIDAAKEEKYNFISDSAPSMQQRNTSQEETNISVNDETQDRNAQEVEPNSRVGETTQQPPDVNSSAPNSHGQRDTTRYNLRKQPRKTEKFTVKALSVHRKNVWSRRNESSYVENIFGMIKSLFAEN